ncbi:MAG: DUF4150 domain-containing protein [Deltaproteobacteria bacterium]|nr:DUF4150 domain-containing protein [Deltaproteobacteria bacterium]
MPREEGARKAERVIVVSTAPAVCNTPIGGVMKPVPYTLVADMGNAEKTASSVNLTTETAFSEESRVPKVEGNEAGTGGGLRSGVHNGYCRPLIVSSNVRFKKKGAVFNNSLMVMNCAGPNGPGDTLGIVIFIKIIDTPSGDPYAYLTVKNEALKDNYPYKDSTFKKIEEMRADILEYSKKYNVPPVAVAGGIADEYNSRRWWLDAPQDAVIDSLSNDDIQLDIDVGIDHRLLNAMKNDIGPGNLKLETAWDLYQRYPNEFPTGWQYTDMVDYILTDRGTSHVAALFTYDAQTTIASQLANLSPEMQEAVLVTCYKRGLDNYVPQLNKTLNKKPFMPGEGVRTLRQRDQLQKALGIEPAKSTDALDISITVAVNVGVRISK